MTEETATNPVEGDDLSPETGVEQDAPEANEDLEAQADNPDAEPADDDSEEVEHEGTKYKLPKALKPALMMQADYTRKTQELADQRKAFEAEKTSFTQANEDFVNAKAELVAADKTLAEYDKIDWQAWAQTDPGQAQAAFIQYQQLRDGRAKLAEDVTAKQQSLTAETQRARAKQAQDGIAVLQRDIPGWGAELAAKLADFGERELGFSRAELDEIHDPRVVKLIHAAFTNKQTQTKTATVQKLQAVQATQPAKTVGGSAATAAKDPERMTTEEWVKWRNAQLRKRG